MRTRIYKRQYWFNELEYETIKEKSERAGMNESDFIRRIILDYQLKEKPPEEFYNVIRQLRSISNNLNQIAAKAHTLGFIDELSYKKEVAKVDNFIDELKCKYLNINISSGE